MLPLVEIDKRNAIVSLRPSVVAYQRTLLVLAILPQNLALYNLSGPVYVRFPRKFDVQTSYVGRLIFVVNIKFPRATYHRLVPSTEELYFLNSPLTEKLYWLAFNSSARIK